jgi:hypothetical protein
MSLGVLRYQGYQLLITEEHNLRKTNVELLNAVTQLQLSMFISGLFCNECYVTKRTMFELQNCLLLIMKLCVVCVGHRL